MASESLCSVRPISVNALSKPLNTIVHEQGLLQDTRCYAFLFDSKKVTSVITQDTSSARAFVEWNESILYFPKYQYDNIYGVVEWLERNSNMDSLEKMKKYSFTMIKQGKTMQSTLYLIQ